jgi:hypothetical protein
MRKREYHSNEKVVLRTSRPWLPPREHYIWSFAIEENCETELKLSIGDEHRLAFYPTKRQARAIARALLAWADERG